MTALFTFPTFLSRLDYADRLNRLDRRKRVIDAVDTVAAYCTTMSMGMEYQAYVCSDENLLSPHALSAADLRNSRQIHSQGWSYDDLAPIVGVPIGELVRIPLDADMLETTEHDEDAISALVALVKVRGVKAANATKFLHQKRPGVFPILDAYARQALDVPWERGEDERAFRSVFKRSFAQIRAIAHLPENRTALDAVETWLSNSPQLSQGLSFTRLRLLDILAWHAVATASR